VNHIRDSVVYVLGKENIDLARARLDAACIKVAAILDAGERDPTWHETQELEAAAIELGRLCDEATRIDKQVREEAAFICACPRFESDVASTHLRHRRDVVMKTHETMMGRSFSHSMPGMRQPRKTCERTASTGRPRNRCCERHGWFAMSNDWTRDHGSLLPGVWHIRCDVKGCHEQPAAE
jgi:hypothetical protein